MNASDSDELADRSERGTNRVASAGYATAADLAANIAPETFAGLTAPEGVSQDEWDHAIKLALLQPPRPVSIVAWLASFEARLAVLEGRQLAAVDEVTAAENDAATIEQWKARALAAEGKLAEAASAERARIAQWCRRWEASLSKRGAKSLSPTMRAKRQIAIDAYTGFAITLEKNDLEEP